MSIAHVVWAENQICGSGVAKAVLVHLAISSGAFDCVESVAAIAETTELSVRATRAALRRLEKLSLIEIEARSHGNGASDTNRYLLKIEAVSSLRRRSSSLQTGAAP